MFNKTAMSLAFVTLLSSSAAYAGFEVVNGTEKGGQSDPVSIATERQENVRLKTELDRLSTEMTQLKRELNDQRKRTEELERQNQFDQPTMPSNDQNQKVPEASDRAQILPKLILPFAAGSTKFVPHPVMSDYLLSSARSAQQISLVGFTDSTGGRSANRRVSLRRAEAVKQYLIENQIDEARIVAEGRIGEYVASNSTRAGRLVNRRVEVEFK
jgi:ompA/motB domain protein